MSREDRRFIVTENESGFISEVKVITDTVTGVNYLFVHDGYAGGLTVLVDQNGDPIVSDFVYDYE